jgi:hypothetical protein
MTVAMVTGPLLVKVAVMLATVDPVAIMYTKLLTMLSNGYR